MTHPNLPYWLALHHAKYIGPLTVKRYLTIFGTLPALFLATLPALQAAGIAEREARSLLSPNWEAVDQDLKWCETERHHIICPEDPAYPTRLKEIADPPLVLYVQGNLDVLASPQIAIVGSRHPTTMGLKHATSFAATLAEAGLTITSGMALGIDAASHQGALSVQGATIAVAGTGLNVRYPKTNAHLVDKMVQGNGAYISEFVLDAPPIPEHFPKRNRIISGLSLGVLVVEAALKSGSLITAYTALEQGREVFALPGSAAHPLKRGCHALIRQGAKLVEQVDDILEELSLDDVSRSALTTETAILSTLTPDQIKLLQHIGVDPTPMDVILLRSGLTAGEISSILLVLELSGTIQSVQGGYKRILSR